MKTYELEIYVNGERLETRVRAKETLLQALRERLGVTEVKNGCAKGDCGACTVLLEGMPVNACLTLALQAKGKGVTTIRGLGNEDSPHPLQRSFVEKGAIQCGFCTPGQILSAKALLEKNPNPTRWEIREAISGNLCRCTGYNKIVEAIEAASAAIQG
ncbi:MAG: (2Fe-2S)-binding protein [Deltaproteobacteria bacterium]|nr:(2Fe-2S)-binding protein [Deltaproteobacteria bacterium]